MTTRARSQFLSTLRDAETALRGDFALIAAQIRSWLLNAAQTDGTISPADWRTLQQKIATALMTYFVSADGHSFVIARNGLLVPTTPFMRRLWSTVTDATTQAVDEQAADMRARLPTNVVQGLEQAKVNPFVALDLLDDDAELFGSYLPQYDVTYDDGRTLADRVHYTAVETQRKVGALIREQLALGTPAEQIGKLVEQFMTGVIKRGGKYGTRASFDASRLLLTETVFAHERAALMSAAANPLANVVDVVLSPSHRDIDECDDMAKGSPYALKDCPIPPYHGHCACSLRFHTTEARADMLARLQDKPLTMNPLSQGWADLLLRGGK